MVRRRKKRYNIQNVFASILTSYSPFAILLRTGFLIISCLLVLIALSKVITLSDLYADMGFTDIIFAILLLIILDELIIATDHLLELAFPVPSRIFQRILIQLAVVSMLIAMVYQLSYFIWPQYKYDNHLLYFIEVGILFFIVIFFAISLIIIRITRKWILSQKKIDVLEHEKTKMNYAVLQKQLNPHFLFNNLSVLKSLIIYDSKTAVKFTEDFTDVYRYVLQSKDKKLIEFSDELEFIESYIRLNKERLGDGLIVKFSIEREMLSMKIPPLTLQLLVENALKHNLAAPDTPLTISIEAKDDYLIIENNLQTKEVTCSTKTGLKNLIARYKHLSENNITIDRTENRFKVKVPLL